MQAVTTIGLDIAKSVFQVHGIDAEDNVLISRRLKRRYVLALFAKLPPCLVGIEACATSHHRHAARSFECRLSGQSGHGRHGKKVRF
jgi:transposase